MLPVLITILVVFVAFLIHYINIVIPILVVVLFIIGLSMVAKADTYTYSNGMKIQAKTYKEAAQLCFTALTKGRFPGETKGLEYIDICANPIGGKVE